MSEVSQRSGVQMLNDQEGWDVLEDIPNDSAAALILQEHHWAVPLRDAIVLAGGFRVSDGFISPLDLVEIGPMSAGEAKELHDLESLAAAGTKPSASTRTRRHEMFGSRRVARHTARRPQVSQQ